MEDETKRWMERGVYDDPAGSERRSRVDAAIERLEAEATAENLWKTGEEPAETSSRLAEEPDISTGFPQDKRL